MKYVFYNELGEDEPVRISIEEAIRRTREAYPEHEMTDEEALDEFMVIHWAWLVEQL